MSGEGGAGEPIVDQESDFPVVEPDVDCPDVTNFSGPPEFLRDLDIRRAILAVLLDAHGPLRSPEVVERLAVIHLVVLEGRQAISPQRRVSDTLRALERRERVRRSERGRYVANRAALSKSMMWRCRNWRLMNERHYNGHDAERRYRDRV